MKALIIHIPNPKWIGKELNKSIPALGVGSLEPLEVPSMTIGQGTGPVNVQQNFKNVKLYGLIDSKITKYDAHLEEYKIYTESTTPNLRLEADYEMQGRVLLLPVQGKGKCTVTMKNLKVNHWLTGEPFEKKGKSYMKLKDYKVTFDPELVTFNFGNLFNGNEQLGTEINKVLNENWESVFGDVKQGYEESFGIIFKDVANRIFTRVAFNNIFLP